MVLGVGVKVTFFQVFSQPIASLAASQMEFSTSGEKIDSNSKILHYFLANSKLSY